MRDMSSAVRYHRTLDSYNRALRRFGYYDHRYPATPGLAWVAEFTAPDGTIHRLLDESGFRILRPVESAA